MKPPPRYCAPAGVAGPRSAGQRADAYNYVSTERYTIFKAACPSKAVDRTKDLPWLKGLALDSTCLPNACASTDNICHRIGAGYAEYAQSEITSLHCTLSVPAAEGIGVLTFPARVLIKHAGWLADVGQSSL